MPLALPPRLSPQTLEQLLELRDRQDAVARREDIEALGVMRWQVDRMLSARKWFKGPIRNIDEEIADPMAPDKPLVEPPAEPPPTPA